MNEVNIILGSQSPRRRELLAGLDLPFTAVTIDADESYPADLIGGDIPLYISRAKARAYTRELSANELLLTADTIVWLDGQVLGKPHSEAEAYTMLRKLSGRTHQVFTGVTIRYRGEETSFVDTTDVTFRELTDEEINYYINKYRPLDKAGAYGIQEYIGYIGVTSLHGSYFNVMGLPVERVYEALHTILKSL